MNEYMKIASELSKESFRTHEGGPFGACIIKDGKVVGRGRNMVLKNNDPTAHAEVMAIRDACSNLGTYDLTGCVLYTSCYPCPMCLSATIWSNMKKVYYGNTKEDAADIGFRDDYIYGFIKGSVDDALDLEMIDRDETIKVFKAFTEDGNRTIY
ncbi:MAG: nucleoside deaminase [Clostridiales bacterium]|jgi:tRNA(Arg) A34 adenosine deaminase TadA|nr:nucleoside deaminase [Clostridiales bacterium]